MYYKVIRMDSTFERDSLESNRVIKRYIRTLHGLIDVIRLSYVRRIGLILSSNSPVVTWLNWLVSWLRTSFQYGQISHMREQEYDYSILEESMWTRRSIILFSWNRQTTWIDTHWTQRDECSNVQIVLETVFDELEKNEICAEVTNEQFPSDDPIVQRMTAVSWDTKGNTYCGACPSPPLKLFLSTKCAFLSRLRCWSRMLHCSPLLLVLPVLKEVCVDMTFVILLLAEHVKKVLLLDRHTVRHQVQVPWSLSDANRGANSIRCSSRSFTWACPVWWSLTKKITITGNMNVDVLSKCNFDESLLNETFQDTQWEVDDDSGTSKNGLKFQIYLRWQSKR